MIKDGLAYHYDLKDHLGNTRVTFSNVPVTTTAQATMEASAAPTEEAVFEGVAESRQTLAFHNTTDASSEEPQPNKVATLAPGEQGPSKSVPVHAGDTVRLQVNARYETVPSQVQGMEGVLSEIAGAVTQSAAGLENSGAITGSNGLAAGGALATGKNQEVPKAYLNYLLYDENYQLVDQGFQQVSQAAAVGKQNPNATPEALALEVPVAEEGFLYTYLSNEPAASGSSSLVYFDDFTVEQQSYIVQVDDYYPFGLTHQQPLSSQLKNKYLYQGIELQTDLNWNSYLADYRTYDPTIGRWGQIDPKVSERESPYAGMANNPILYIDPLGDTIDISNLSARQQATYNSQIEALKESKLFTAYYDQLVESKNVYTISAKKGKEGAPNEAGQFFNSATNEVGLGEGMGTYVMAQELFHAFQHDGKFYSGDNPRPSSTIETEGDILTQYVVFEAGLGAPIYGDWSQDFMLDAMEGVPSINKVTSVGYQKMFQTAVDNRIEYYKKSGLNVPSYTSPNTGVKPKALEAAIRLMKR